MKYTTIAASATFLTTVLSATVPSAPWTSLTPTASIPSDATTDYTSSFGIQIETVEAASALSTDSADNLSSKLETASATLKRRDVVSALSDGQPNVRSGSYSILPTSKSSVAPVAQITDGQIQHQTSATATPVAQITDGQIQHQTTASVVNQITDGQIQHQTSTASTASVVNQITDGQIQHQTTASVVNQITDGQIQHQTSAASTASVVNQITDGQIQHQTSTTATASAAAQISDGQIQHQNSTVAAESKAAATTASDGQAQESGVSTDSSSDSSILQACSSSNNLVMTLEDSVLTDSKGRIGAIVANRQFQFDGPPPQSGSIYAAGWSISNDGYLTLGDSKVFYQCLSGDFYNLYDENVAAQCNAVKLKIVDFVDC
ncbi:hypothetical protein CANMA_004048 [Candida margitis]|uniref:uncharacterized protein n=1 Tax=Candida margitis TaxID=1775924 RepID=UPI00222681CA|nr:uncharacterized protein CANMA_004048 [Candida margitis]KAI5960268.1 hypothetical protein CANMA_004048 [Candida margitis]